MCCVTEDKVRNREGLFKKRTGLGVAIFAKDFSGRPARKISKNHATAAARQESRSSRPRELPPQALTEPYVRLSPHTALHVPCKLPSLHKSLVPPISG